MKWMRSTLTLAALAVAAAPSVGQAQGALPDGRSVIERFITAIGGRDAIMRQTARHVVGKIEMPAQGLSGDIDLWAEAPNKMAMTVTLAGIGSFRRGYDGTVGWSTNPMAGPALLDSLELRQAQQGADFYGTTLYPDSMFKSIETVADTTFDGKPCYKVKLTTAWDEEYAEFFEKETGLQAGGIRSQASPQGDIEVVTTQSDWRPVDGVLMPFKSVQNIMGMQQIITTFTSVETTTPPDSVFALPPEIKALTGK
jgi:hypothetical protein